MPKCVLALGFFDGVHLAHGALLRRARALADELGVSAAALTFDVSPDTVVRGCPVPLLNTPEERELLMRRLYGLDAVHVLHFDGDLMRRPWREFAEDVLFGALQAVGLVCGYDFRFGAGGAGTPEALADLCSARGAAFACVPEVRLEGQTVSSTLIRALLSEGQTARAVRFLGHPHLLSGQVIGGRGLGRTLGIPTANFRIAEGVLVPKRGVYAARACFAGGERPAVVNIGVRPTVGGGEVTVEPWLLDYNGDLYGRRLWLLLADFLREERKFPSLDALRTEILRNAAQTRALLAPDAKN